MWPSGRRRSPAKGVGEESSRGFESLRLRHLSIFIYLKTIYYGYSKIFAPTFAPTILGIKPNIRLQMCHQPSKSYTAPFWA